MEKTFQTEKKNRILEICEEVVSRLSDPQYVHSIIFAENNISVFGDHPWGDLVLSSGNLSVCLLMAQWDKFYPDSNFDVIAHKYFIEMQEVLKKQGIPNNISMFSGLTGMAFVLTYASHSGERYTKFIASLNQLIFDMFDVLIKDIQESDEIGVSPFWYDVISGLSGAGRYLLLISDQEEAKKRLIKILKYCISLVEPIQVRGSSIPGWYVAPQNLFTDDDRRKFPDGSFNCGLAHGIAGPLSLLSLAAEQGIEVEGQKEAISIMVEWLSSKRKIIKQGIIWPSWVSFDEEIQNNIDNVKGKDEIQYRDAWCYGTAGVCRSIYLASKALDNKLYGTIAKEGFKAILERDVEDWNLDGATFCHGYAGLLQMANRMFIDTQDVVYAKLIDKVSNEIIKLADEKNPFVFKDFEGANHIDKAGDKLEISFYNNQTRDYDKREVTVMAVIQNGKGSEYGPSAIDINTIILSDSMFKSIYPDWEKMISVIKINVDDTDNYAEQESRIKEVLGENGGNTATMRSMYASILHAEKNKEMIALVGGFFSIFLALIGIVNVINTFVTEVIAQRLEYTRMQAVGMTNRQLYFHLVGRNSHMCLLGLLIGIPIAAIMSNMVGNMQLFTGIKWFPFIIGVILTFLMLAFLSCMIAFFLVKYLNAKSIVERLRSEE